MLVREWAHLLAVDDNGADYLVILQHRHHKKGPSAGRFSDSDKTPSAGEITLIQPNVSDMDHLPRCDETKQGALLVRMDYWRSEERRVGKECRCGWSQYH